MNSEDMKAAREETGYSFYQIKEGMRLSGSDDPLFGAAYIHAASLAVLINPPEARHRWNMDRAQNYLGRNNLT